MKTAFYLSVIALTMTICSCKKDQSIFNGTVQYKDISGTTQTASGADISLYREVVGGSAEMTTTTGSDGTYAFRDVPDGHYIIYGEIQVAGITYTGQTQLLFCEKDDVIDAGLLLE